MAIFCADDEHVTSIHCGDCRLGHFAQDHQVNWVTRTHSLSAFMGAGEDVVPADDDYRRIVTKSVGVRFPAPEMASHRGNGSSDWVLATDGYWLQGGHFDGSIGHADDKSALIIDWSGDRVVDSDAENFICLG
jgi:serine/threonine protein phosphatase PrpC